MKKGLLFLTISAFMLVLIVGGVGAFQAVQAMESYVCIDVNPSVELVLNRNNMVTKVNALNSDALLVLSGMELVNKSAQEATEMFLAAATEMGFIDTDATEENPNAVLITVINSNLNKGTQLKNFLLTKVDDYMINNGIWGIAFSADQMEEIVAEAKALGVSPGKLRMVKAVQISYPDKTTEELMGLSVRQLISLAREKNPADVIVSAYEERLATLTAIPEEERTLEEIEEILDITEKLSNIEALREKVALDKAALQERNQEKHNDFLENREARKAQRQAERENFINQAQERLQEILQNRFGNRFN